MLHACGYPIEQFARDRRGKTERASITKKLLTLMIKSEIEESLSWLNASSKIQQQDRSSGVQNVV